MDKCLLITIILYILPFPSLAYDFEMDGIYYNILSDNTVEITNGTSNYQGNVRIPSSVTIDQKAYKVTSIGTDAFYGCNDLTSVTIPNSVNYIGRRAFRESKNLASINIPDKVTSIGVNAFYGCTGLKTVHISDLLAWLKISFDDVYANPCDNAHGLYLNGEKLTVLKIPNEVTEIKNYAFYGCSSLESIIIPNGVTTIGKRTFQGCEGISSIVLPNSMKEIGEYAFFYCRGLSSVTIGNSVVSIGEKAFSNCTSLVSLSIPNSVSSIGDGVFSGCSSLSSITIPNSVTRIGAYAFNGCSKLSAVHINDLSSWLKISIGYLGNPCEYAHRLFLNGKELTEITIPDDITVLKDNVFYGCSDLISVNIPTHVTSIGNSSFYKCEGLKSVILPNSVSNIGEWAFGYCKNLTSLVLGNNVNNIGFYAFNNCTKLTSVVSKVQVPFSINANVFSEDQATLFVPNGTKDKYITTSGWADCFSEIVECADSYSLKITSIGNGNVDYGGYSVRNRTVSYNVDIGGSVTISLLPDNNCYLKSLIVNGKEAVANVLNKEFTITFITSNTEIEVSFEDIVDADFSSFGDGTIDSPYIIDTIDQWDNLSKATNNGNSFQDKHFLVNSDLDYEGKTYTPIGTPEYPFCGVVDFDNHSIKNIHLKGDYSGVFGVIRNAKVANLNILVAQEGYGNYIGGLAGYAESSFINNITTEGNFYYEEDNYVGGIIGYSVGSTVITNCKNTIRIMGKDYTGGIIGYLSNGGSVTNCISKTTTIIFYGLGGGIAGYNNGIITNCYTSFTGEGNLSKVGGVTGINDSLGKIQYCYYYYQYPDFPNVYTNSGTVEYCVSFDWSGNISGIAYNNETILSSALNAWVNSNQTTDNLYRQFESCKHYPEFTVFTSGYSYPLIVTKYNLSVKSTGSGTLTYNGTNVTNTTQSFTVVEGSAVTITITPNSGYKLSSLIVNGTNVTSSVYNNQYTINSITSNTSIEATFKATPQAFMQDGISYTPQSEDDYTVNVGRGDYSGHVVIPATVTYDGDTWTVAGVVDGAFNHSGITAITWNPRTVLSNSAFGSDMNPNMLVYVQSESYAPTNVQNIVANGRAKKIVLTDAASGNDFNCPVAFTAEEISYTHRYGMTTGIGECRGWETIALPFDVKQFTHESKGKLIPFKVYSSTSAGKPFWLYELTATGFVEAEGIEANKPYIISMPNNSYYVDTYNLAGKVTFSAENVSVLATADIRKSTYGEKTFVPAFTAMAASINVYALNANNDYCTNTDYRAEGSTFIRESRSVHPFEAYMTTSSANAKREMCIFDDLPTAIREIPTQGEKGVRIYSMSGELIMFDQNISIEEALKHLKRGVYFVNGKKIVVNN